MRFGGPLDGGGPEEDPRIYRPGSWVSAGPGWRLQSFGAYVTRPAVLTEQVSVETFELSLPDHLASPGRLDDPFVERGGRRSWSSVRVAALTQRLAA